MVIKTDETLFSNLKVGQLVKVYDRNTNKLIGVGHVVETGSITLGETTLNKYPKQVEILGSTFNDIDSYFLPMSS